MIVLVMGVSGSGKSTIGGLLASRLGARFMEGDDFHPSENIAKMSLGLPLDDEDRAPWLARMAAELEAAAHAGESVVLACSALKRDYRARLLGRSPGSVLVWLDGEEAVIAERLRGRSGHFMPPALLQSQLETLEPPSTAIRVAVDRHPADIVLEVLAALTAAENAGRRGE